MLEKIIQLAKDNDYDSAEFIEKWNGYNVYQPIFTDDEPHYIGIPEIILEKNGVIRFGTPYEDKAYIASKVPPMSEEEMEKCLQILNEPAQK